ncbi:DUF4296 domain-containing protein [Ancylomarina euxinus]|uniref:DUF4296 domain-containing protein n=1 Tax=Ancylomarina euxinus TaxID=2283627 RepID=A0A425XZH0_9BACT|nr:DUF4296 domain-containing protein [Ancylomarina euxinus]MCZ4695505.1 DUF4296 domain-containing protein [Ancylomarina euxinus]MUP15677.1 DUF4296 domain-containing protein [Ancylomarina euxinus]RRG20670.1 DUF4296 domain-containing protein [Ancylomarina euxinus]
MNKQLIFLFFATLLLFSCSKKEEKTYLSKDDFTRILFDIHLTDGVLTSKNIVNRGSEYRPSFYYNSIYKKYNITPEQFDSCVSFYTQNSALYEKIYEKVIDSLNRMETQFRIALKDSLVVRDTVNLWKGRRSVFLARGRHENLSFSIPITEKGIYTVRADVKRFKDDQSRNPFLKAYFWKEDSLKKSERINFDSIPIEHSDDFVRYETQLEFSDSTFKELRGDLIVWSNVDSNFTQHIQLKDIMIFNPQIKRDSLGLDSIVRMKRFGREEFDEYEEINRPQKFRELDKPSKIRKIDELKK